MEGRKNRVVEGRQKPNALDGQVLRTSGRWVNDMHLSNCVPPTRHNTNPAALNIATHGKDTLLHVQADCNGIESPSGGVPVMSHQPAGSTTPIFHWWPHDILTRMISLTATTPEVAIILALFGIKLKIVGIMASAPWSNLFPRTDDRWLQQERTSYSHILTHMDALSLSTYDSPPPPQ